MLTLDIADIIRSSHGTARSNGGEDEVEVIGIEDKVIVLQMTSVQYEDNGEEDVD